MFLRFSYIPQTVLALKGFLLVDRPVPWCPPPAVGAAQPNPAHDNDNSNDNDSPA